MADEFEARAQETVMAEYPSTTRLINSLQQENKRLRGGLKQIGAFAMLGEMDDDDRDNCEEEYGLSIEELIEMGHDNMISIAQATLAASDPIETLARQLYEAAPKPPGPPDPPFGSPHFPKSEAEKYRAMARDQLSVIGQSDGERKDG